MAYRLHVGVICSGIFHECAGYFMRLNQVFLSMALQSQYDLEELELNPSQF